MTFGLDAPRRLPEVLMEGYAPSSVVLLDTYAPGADVLPDAYAPMSGGSTFAKSSSRPPG